MVISERIAMLMVGGPKARNEAGRMVAEKVPAASGAAATLATGWTPREVVRSYCKKVQPTTAVRAGSRAIARLSERRGRPRPPRPS